MTSLRWARASRVSKGLASAQGIIERISRMAVYVGGVLLFLAAMLVTVEVVLRKYFGIGLNGADELSGYAFGISMTWGFAYVLLKRGHIRVDVIYVRLPEWARRVLDIVQLSCFGALIALVTWKTWEVLQNTIALGARSNTPLSTPLWIPQALWFAGYVFFLIAIAVLMARSLLAFAAGDLVLVRQLVASPSVADEAKEELENLQDVGT